MPSPIIATANRCVWRLRRVCRSLGMQRPTQVQAGCIPAILAGRDVLGTAHTGSGKTAAFALPILQRLARDPYGVFALVLTPTRELAMQLADQFRALGAGMSLTVCTASMPVSGHPCAVCCMCCMCCTSPVCRLSWCADLAADLAQDAVIIGGLEMQAQAKALAARPHVVIATPGRLRVSPSFLSQKHEYSVHTSGRQTGG